MQLEINEVAIPRIDRQQAAEIRNAFLSAHKDGSMWVHGEMKDKYPAAYELYQLLTSTFESSVTGVHNIRV